MHMNQNSGILLDYAAKQLPVYVTNLLGDQQHAAPLEHAYNWA